ncbi:MAG: S49 family peptidase [bacterium]
MTHDVPRSAPMPKGENPMLAFLRTFFAVIAAIVFLVMVPLVVLVSFAVMQDTGPRKDSWLVVKLNGPLMEWYGPSTVRDLFDDSPPCLMEITENLEKAAVDPRIRGVILKIGPLGAGPGKLDEIRAGLAHVRHSGKRVYAHAQQLTDAGLYLASACDSTFLLPEGEVMLLGRGVTIPHFKGTLEKLDVHDQLDVIGEYKSAAELFTAKQSSKEAVENLKWLFDELGAAYDDTLSAARKLDPGALAKLRGRAILRAKEAKEAGLVDGLAYWDELEERLKSPHDELRTVSSQDYAKIDRRSLGLAGRKKIAVVHGQGFISSDGEDRYDAMWGIVMGPDRVVEDLDRARRDDGVDAILLRWDTPGGATDGSQRIARAVARAREDKPVVVSIADEAASGGYMVSFPADRIVCPPNGITGSIGSITGKLNMRGLWEKAGITFDDLAFSPNAFLYSDLHDWTPEQRQLVSDEHHAFYRDWVESIAKARHLPPDKVDENGRGKVWTGREAKERGLVDSLGGWDDAVSVLRQVAKLRENEKLDFEHWPKKESLMEVLLSGHLGRMVTSEVVLQARESVAATMESSNLLLWEPLSIR